MMLNDAYFLVVAAPGGSAARDDRRTSSPESEALSSAGSGTRFLGLSADDPDDDDEADDIVAALAACTKLLMRESQARGKLRGLAAAKSVHNERRMNAAAPPASVRDRASRWFLGDDDAETPHHAFGRIR